MVVSNVTDAFGNVITPTVTTSAAFTAVADTTAPTVTSVTTLTTSSTNPCAPSGTGAPAFSTNGPCGQVIFQVNYSESMVTAAATASNYTWPANAFGVISGTAITTFACSGGTISSSGGTFTGDSTNKSVVCTLNQPIQPGTYPVTINAAVTDLSTNAITTGGNTPSVTYVDITRPTASTVSSASQSTSATMTVNFSEVMNTSGGASGTSSVLNPANYKLDNTTLTTTNTTIVCGASTAGVTVAKAASACNSVVLTITSGTILTPIGSHALTVSTVADLNSNAVNPNPTSLAFSST